MANLEKATGLFYLNADTAPASKESPIALMLLNVAADTWHSKSHATIEAHASPTVDDMKPSIAGVCLDKKPPPSRRP